MTSNAPSGVCERRTHDEKLLTAIALTSLAAVPSLASEDGLTTSKKGEPATIQEDYVDMDMDTMGEPADTEVEVTDCKEGQPATADGDLVDRSTETNGPK